MNDRFKFRGVVKLDSQNIIIYSSFLKIYDDELILSVSESELKKQIYESGYKLTEKDKDILWGYSDKDDYYPWFDLTCEIIEQCTGLKDKNGKLIYEGDILGYFDNKIAVVYDNDLPSFRLRGVDGSSYGLLSQEYVDSFGFKIIGNIHEKEAK